MGKREKDVKAAKIEEHTSSEEDKRKRKSRYEAAISDDDDAEANEDLSLKIVQKSMQRVVSNGARDSGVSEIVSNLKEDKCQKASKKRKKSKEIEVPGDEVAVIDTGFRDFCGELFLVANMKDNEKPESNEGVEVPSEAAEISGKDVVTSPTQVLDNVVLRKLLRGPRYFDPPDNNWGACYNCGEEGHTIVNCTSAKRKKPCFVCGSFEHNAKQCSKGRDCFICKQQGHRAKDCPQKHSSSKMCLKCGDMGHDMFTCVNDYFVDDLKEIQCYICGRFGHLCCRGYSDPGPRVVSCYRCGQSGHTGLSCLGYREDTKENEYASSCFRCGLVGHFARECSSSVKSSKRNREPSTPKQRSSKRSKDHLKANSFPHDLGKTRKRKYLSGEHTPASKTKHRGSEHSATPKSKHRGGNYSPAPKTKHRGGWSTDDPGDYSSRGKGYNWRSPSTSGNGRYKNEGGDYLSASHSSGKNHYNNSSSNGSTGYHQHRHSASRYW